jgi:hypothetical protein
MPTSPCRRVRRFALRRRARAWTWAALAAATLAACGADPRNPGAPLGTFHVTGTLVRTNCGAVSSMPALQGDVASAPPIWEFDVRLGRQGSTLYWIQGDLPVSGTIQSSGAVSMNSTSTFDVVPAGTRGVEPCALDRYDALVLLLGEAPVTQFTGSLAYTFAPSQGTVCSQALAAGGGSFDTLPCQIAYALTANRTVAPPSPPAASSSSAANSAGSST